MMEKNETSEEWSLEKARTIGCNLQKYRYSKRCLENLEAKYD